MTLLFIHSGKSFTHTIMREQTKVVVTMWVMGIIILLPILLIIYAIDSVIIACERVLKKKNNSFLKKGGTKAQKN